MGRRIRRKKQNNIKKIIFGIITLITIVVILLVCYKINYNRNIELKQSKLKQEVLSHYNEFVITNKDTELYKLEDSEYQKIGMVGKNQELILEDMKITHKDKYFKITTFEEEYYVYYKDVDVIKELSKQEERYKKYIVFNKNVVTKEVTNFYDEGNNLVYKIPETFDLPIIVNKKDAYGVEFNNRLLYIRNEDIAEIKVNNNTKNKNSKGVPVLNYHFVYDPKEEKCNQILCHTIEQFETHLSYIKENNIFTLKMKELEMYIDGEIQLPKSVVLTIDDGRNVNLATEILEKFELNATAFIVTSRYDMKTEFIKSEYVELHSHSHNLHDAGTCPPGHGQGGGLTCLSDNKILEDLKTSREQLNGSTAFCYPFYEYNSHSIELLKKAGFTMAFAGEYTGGYTKAVVGINKFRIPRWVIVDYTTMKDFKSYVNGTV